MNVTHKWLLAVLLSTALCFAQAAQAAKQEPTIAEVAPYLEQLATAIRQGFNWPDNWHSRQKLQAKASFEKASAELLQDVRIKRSSNDETFDRALRGSLKTVRTPGLNMTDADAMEIEATFTTWIDEHNQRKLDIQFDSAKKKRYPPFWRFGAVLLRVLVPVAAVPILIVQTIVIAVGIFSIRKMKAGKPQSDLRGS